MDIEVDIDVEVLRRLARESPQLYKQAVMQCGQALETEAENQLKVGPNRAIASGQLASRGITMHTGGEGEDFYAQINAYAVGKRGGANYAVFVHEGTGIYGPLKRPFTVRAGPGKVLPIRIHGGDLIFRKSAVIKGMKPRPFLLDALRAVIPRLAGIIEQATGVWVGKSKRVSE
jgi:hypothetical protein